MKKNSASKSRTPPLENPTDAVTELPWFLYVGLGVGLYALSRFFDRRTGADRAEEDLDVPPAREGISAAANPEKAGVGDNGAHPDEAILDPSDTDLQRERAINNRSDLSETMT